MSRWPHQRPESSQLAFRLFERSLHPELILSVTQRSAATADFRFRIWICEGGQVLSLQRGPTQVTEIIGPKSQSWPTRELRADHRLGASRDWSFSLTGGLCWHVSAHVERLGAEAYRSVYQELTVDARTAFLTHEFPARGSQHILSTDPRPANPGNGNPSGVPQSDPQNQRDAAGVGEAVSRRNQVLRSVNRLSPGGLSVIQVEPGPQTLGIRGYHLFPENESILRIQTLVDLT